MSTWARLGIGWKLALGSTLFLSMVSLFVYEGYLFTANIAGDAELINSTGSLRYRTMKIGLLAEDLMSADSLEVRSNRLNALRGEIEGYEHAYEAILTHLERHGRASASDGEMSELAGRVSEEWMTSLKPLLLGIGALPGPGDRASLEKYRPLAYENVSKLNALVLLMQQKEERELSVFNWYRVAFIAIMAAISGVTVFLVRNYFLQPIFELKKSFSAIEHNQLGHRSAINGDDEFGELGASFNKMAHSLEESFREISEFNEELYALHRTSNSMAQLSHSDELYRYICERLQEAFDLRMVWLGLTREGDPVVYPVAVAGAEDGYLSSIRVTRDDTPTGEGPIGASIKTRQSRAVAVEDPSFACWSEEAHKRGFSSVVGVPLLSGERCLGALGAYSADKAFFNERRKALLQVFGNQAASLIENAELIECIIYSLARAAELNDEDTGNHILRVGEFCAALARQLKMNDSAAAIIKLQATLHDVGKIHVRPEILRKTTPLTAEEWKAIKRHPEAGARIVGSHPMLRTANLIARHHHERWDGSGYPLGLKGAAISMEARIVSIADQYDALRSARPYKPPFDHATAVGILIEGDGRTVPGCFDPAVHRAFSEITSEFDDIYGKFNS